MILLGINAGLGNTDVSELPQSAIDYKRAVLDFPRPKTGIERRATLWPETIKAIKAAIAERPAPKDPADEKLVFITRCGQRWCKYRETGNINSVGLVFARLLVELGIKRPGCSFYALRHTFETIAGETRDQAAVDRIMGHEDGGMATRYREWTKGAREDQRLRRVTDYVRKWLFGPRGQKSKAPESGEPIE